MEQKLELVEKELIDYKAKYSAKDADFKEVNKELNRTRKELQALTNKSHQNETEYQEELAELKQAHEIKIRTLREELEDARSNTSTSNASPDGQISKQADKRF